MREVAIRTYTCLCCEGMARVDVFVTPEGQVLVNEVNTIPGFTDISMYPQMWAKSGLPYSDLITKLLELAISRYEEENKMMTSI